MLPPVGDGDRPGSVPLRATLLGQFSIKLDQKSAGPWRRPPAKRLCELVLLNPGRRVGREAAIDTLFPRRGAASGRSGLSQALSYAREALSALGDVGTALLQADRALIWANPAVDLEIDLQLVHGKLRDALASQPGLERDDQLLEALADQSTLLEDEPLSADLSRIRAQPFRKRQSL